MMKFFTIFNIIIVLSCSNVIKESTTIYRVMKLEKYFQIDTNWVKESWNEISPLKIDKYMGDKPKHIPKTQAKVAYDDKAIYVIFRVEDQYLRAVNRHYQDRVFEDSCVEFFFTPDTDITQGYFNLEMNCLGTALFRFQKAPRTELVKIEEADFNLIEVAHSMPDTINSEIQQPITWSVEYRIPFSVLEKYTEVTNPAFGVSWRANFYKCADKSSHPHWLTWAQVDYPKPNFHLPEFFGVLKFE